MMPGKLDPRGAPSNRSVAMAFFETTKVDGSEAAVASLADDAAWRTVKGAMTKLQIAEVAVHPSKVLVEPIRFAIDTVTAEEDRIAVEARSRALLMNSKRYSNTYHFLMRVRDGRVCEVREHCETDHALQTFGSDL